jgi:hypothetical protein
MSDAKQKQRSQQSMKNPAGDKQQGSAPGKSDQQSRTGIGSSQGQDRESRSERDRVPHTGPGTADIERSSAGAQGSTDSLADDPVGAYKERP